MPAPAVYLDHAATTPLDPKVLAAMQPYFAAEYGNPSSIHAMGQHAEAAVERARSEVAAVLRCPTQDVIFTSGGSESDNLALRGAAFASRELRGARRVLTTPVEHPAVLRTAEALARQHGFSLDLLPVDHFGQVDPDDLRRRLTPDTAVVSVIHANNEIGTVNPVTHLARLCAEQGIPGNCAARTGTRTGGTAAAPPSVGQCPNSWRSRNCSVFACLNASLIIKRCSSLSTAGFTRFA